MFCCVCENAIFTYSFNQPVLGLEQQFPIASSLSPNSNVLHRTLFFHNATDPIMSLPYSHKLPSSVRDAMKQFTGNECFLIKRRNAMLLQNGIEGNCHFNVENHIKADGGKRVTGWLLFKNRDLNGKGVWAWTFHSVWQLKDGSIVDITDDKNYIGQEYSTVWLDNKRDVDLAEGKNFNAVVVFSSDHAAQAIGSASGKPLRSGTTYWTTKAVNQFKNINEHSGMYRWIDIRFPNNTASLEKEYNCQIKNGQIVSKSGRNIDKNIYFDYGVG